MLDLIRQLCQDFRAHQQRTCLAMFGIAWGTLSVVVLVAIGQGFYTAGQKSLVKVSGGVVFVIPSSTTKSFHGLPQGRILHVKAGEVMRMGEAMQTQSINPKLNQMARLAYQGNAHLENISGVASVFNIMNDLKLQNNRGRFINDDDIHLKRRVVVLGGDIASVLFSASDALEKTVTINRVPFNVIGVLATNHAGFNLIGSRMAFDVFIPYTTFITLFGNKDISYFSALPIRKNASSALKNSIINYFATYYRFDPDDTQALDIPDVNAAAEFFTLFFRGVQFFLGFCGVMTLGVGGVGVANMMFLVVAERTREIGLRIALGATPYHIMRQTLLEACLIVFLGALVGFGFAWLIILCLQHISLPTWLGMPVLSFTALFVTLSMLLFVALLAGFFPARQAAVLDPIVALSS